MSVTVGTRLGPYEILAKLGEGGMGEVYRARDTTLNRDVAIKVLLPAVADDPDRLARFRREAQVLASLNHPNIAQIFGVEGRALVMELVEGQDLSVIIDGAPGLQARGTIPGAKAPGLHLNDALPIARQIADALGAAHEAGVIHRDLKPANIKVRADGTVKVLDFGLAKALDPMEPRGFSPGEPDADAPTMTSPALMTRRGAILGTAAYMAPEQARGKAVDKRADIWAFGVVLYEMLTGRRPFRGDAITDVLAAIVRDQPDFGAVPPTLRRLVQKCLEKDPRLRLRDIGDAWELIEAGPAGAGAPLLAAPSRVRERFWTATAAVFAVAAIGVTAWTFSRPVPRLDAVQFTMASPETTTVGNFGPGFMAVSPDGRRVAMAATGGGKSQLWVRALDSLTPQVLPGTEDGYQPAWSPDSRSIAFIQNPTGGKLKRADLAGGAPLTLAEFASGSAAWSRDHVILFTGRDARLYRISDTGGQPVAVTELDASRQETSHFWPIFLPDGRRFIFLAHSSDASKNALFLGSLDSSSRTHLVDVLSCVAYAQGYLFYQRDGTLMAQPFDEKGGRLDGDAAPVVEGIDYNAANGRAVFSVSSTGTLVYRANFGNAYGAATLTWFDRQGKPVGIVGEPGSYRLGTSQLSRDGRRLAVSRGDARTAQRDIWTIDLERNVMTRLTSDPAHDLSPVWSADGAHVIFASHRKGEYDLYQRAADGSGADQLLFASAQQKTPTGVSPDGKLLLFTWKVDERKDDVWALPLTVGRTPFAVVSTEFDERNAVFSPDGHWVAYDADESGSDEIYLQAFPASGSKVRVSTTGGSTPRWSADGKQIVYGNGGRFFSVDLTSPLRPGAPKELFTQPYLGGWTIDPSAQRFLVPVPNEVAPAAVPMTVVLNWTAGLGRK